MKPEVRTDTGSLNQDRTYHGEKENPALNLQGKCQCLKFSLGVFSSCSTGRVQAHISWLQSQSNPPNLSLHHKHVAQATHCCQTSSVQEHQGEPCATGLGQRLKTLAEQSREAACNRCLPSHTWELPGSDSAGQGQNHARNISCLKTENFRFLCLGGRNTPSDFIALIISEGAADSDPTRVTGGGTAAAL